MSTPSEYLADKSGNGYQLTEMFRVPTKDEPHAWIGPFKDEIRISDGKETSKYHIYKLIAPAIKKYEREGDAYEFTGRIGTAKTHEYFYNEKGQMISGAFPQNAERPIYTLLAQKHTEKHPVEKTNEYFDKASEVLDEVYDALNGISAFGDNLKKEYSAPPPFIKQGEDYFLYVKHDVVQKGDWFCSTDGNMIRQALNGIMNINRYIYEKLPLTVIQDGVQYVFTGEYRVPEKNDFAYFNTSKNVYHCSGGGGALPIYITFEDYYWKQYPAMDAAGKKYASFRTAPLLRQWADENMSGAAIQKLQEMNRRELSVTECLQLFEYWLLKNPVLDYGHIEYDKKPLFQYFKCEKENGAYTAQTISIMKAIVYNGAAYEKEKTICFPSGHIEGINHRYQKELSFEELKSLNVQFMSIGKFFSSVNDSQFIESAINYKILE